MNKNFDSKNARSEVKLQSISIACLKLYFLSMKNVMICEESKGEIEAELQTTEKVMPIY